jgi:hypothetical protein
MEPAGRRSSGFIQVKEFSTGKGIKPHRQVSFLFGFQVISDFGERGCAMKAGSRQVLLLFKKGGSRDMVSPHDGDGELHLAFAIAADEAGKRGWPKTESLWKRRELGSSVVTAFISGIRTGTSSRLLHPESGQFIDAVALFRLSLVITVTEVNPNCPKSRSASSPCIGS